MDQVPTQIIIAAYTDEQSASQALNDLKRAAKDGLIKIDDAAVLSRDSDGKLHIKETADMSGGKGAAIGGVLGAAVSLIAGPVGWLAAGGAIIGGLAARHRDAGFSDDRLKQVGDALVPGSSAIVAVIEHRWVADVERQLAKESTDIVTLELRDDIARELAKGNEVTYSSVAAGDAVAAARVVSEPDADEPDVDEPTTLPPATDSSAS